MRNAFFFQNDLPLAIVESCPSFSKMDASKTGLPNNLTGGKTGGHASDCTGATYGKCERMELLHGENLCCGCSKRESNSSRAPPGPM